MVLIVGGRGRCVHARITSHQTDAFKLLNKLTMPARGLPLLQGVSYRERPEREQVPLVIQP